MYNNIKKYGLGVALLAPLSVFAQSSPMVTAATTALDSAKADATSVGALVLAAIAVVVAAGIVFAMIRKA